MAPAFYQVGVGVSVGGIAPHYVGGHPRPRDSRRRQWPPSPNHVGGCATGGAAPAVRRRTPLAYDLLDPAWLIVIALFVFCLVLISTARRLRLGIVY